MVFVDSHLSCTYPYDSCKDLGLVTLRITGKYLALLLIESMFGLIVGLSNLIIIIVLVLGWRRLMKNHFYIVLSNLIVCTSLKAFVEFAFIVPYYVLQGSVEPKDAGTEDVKAKPYFSTQYEFIIFNITVFADYGVLFFSVLIAINRFLTVARAPEDIKTPARHQGRKTGLSCGLVWICSASIPALFVLCECQYAYDTKVKVYHNTCAKLFDVTLIILLDCLIYLSYVCTLVILVLYILLLLNLRRQREKLQKNGKKTSIPRAQLQLLKQSVVVFIFYAASILCVFALSFSRPSGNFPAFDIAYIENLLNLLIAAVYPICFLITSGEMRSIIVRKFTPHSVSVSSIRSSSNNERIRRIEITP